jgi:hypothetical protein
MAAGPYGQPPDISVVPAGGPPSGGPWQTMRPPAAAVSRHESVPGTVLTSADEHPTATRLAAQVT